MHGESTGGCRRERAYSSASPRTGGRTRAPTSSRPSPGVEIMPLDVTDTISVNELAAEMGDKADILVNTAEYVRPGSPLDRHGVTLARDEMETNYFGSCCDLMQAFGHGMRARGADGDNSACAWVNLLSVYAPVELAGLWHDVGEPGGRAVAVAEPARRLRRQRRQGHQCVVRSARGIVAPAAAAAQSHARSGLPTRSFTR